MTRFFCVCLVLLLFATPSSAQFENAKIIVDTQTEETPVNNAVKTAPLLKTGESFSFQIFIQNHTANATILGFQITFDSSLFTVDQASAFQGTPLLQSGSWWAALIIAGAQIPSSGLLAAFTLTATQDIADGTALIISEAQLTAGSADLTNLDVSEGFVVFTSKLYVAAIGGDIDFDGDVDFLDFVVFASNFGETGPVPTDPATLFSVPTIITVTDTIIQTVLDTVHVTRLDTVILVDTLIVTQIDTFNIRDTIIVSQDPFAIRHILGTRSNVFSDRLAVALDADPAEKYQIAIASNGLEVEIRTIQVPISGFVSANIYVTYNRQVLRFRDSIPPRTDDGIFIADWAPVSETAPGELRIQTGFGLGGNFPTNKSNASFGKIRFARLGPANAQVTLKKVEFFYENQVTIEADDYLNSTVTLFYGEEFVP